MQRFFMLALVFLGFTLAGCNREPAKPPEKKGIDVNVPGVNIHVDKGSVDVKAPGAAVTVPK